MFIQKAREAFNEELHTILEGAKTKNPHGVWEATIKPWMELSKAALEQHGYECEVHDLDDNLIGCMKVWNTALGSIEERSCKISYTLSKHHYKAAQSDYYRSTELTQEGGLAIQELTREVVKNHLGGFIKLVVAQG